MIRAFLAIDQRFWVASPEPFVLWIVDLNTQHSRVRVPSQLSLNTSIVRNHPGRIHPCFVPETIRSMSDQ